MKKLICNIGIILMVMFLLPLTVAKLAPANAGMVLCFILFFAVNPVFSVIEGIYSGLDIKRKWYIPLVVAVVFLLSTWSVFDMGETAFILYSVVYLLICITAMLITYAIKCSKDKKNKGVY